VLCLLLLLPAIAHAAVEKTILSNGLTLLVKREPESRTAAIEVFIRVGAAQENKQTEGIGHLLAGTILSGSERRTPRRLAEVVSEVGGNFHAVWQWDYIEIYAVTLPRMCDEAIGLLAESISSPSFEPDAVERARSAVLKQMKALEDNQYSTGYNLLVAQVHKGNPYGRPYLGDPDVIRAINRQQLEAFYRKYVVPSAIVISVVGNVDPMRISRLVELRFAGMEYAPQKPTGVPFRFRPEPPQEPEPPAPEQTAASYVMIGWVAPGAADKDYPAVCIANVLLGGNKSSLMFTKLREGQGIGYQVGSIYPVLKGSGHIAAYVGLDSSRGGPEVTQAVKASVMGLASTLATGGFTDDDIERAKSYLIGSHALKHERARDRAYYLGLYESLGLGYRYDSTYAAAIRAVTRADLERVCASIFTHPPTVVTVGR
jgi:predicted Zn-dependent peptidase